MRLELVTVNSKLAFATEKFFPKTRSLESTSKNKISKKIFFVENYFGRKFFSSKFFSPKIYFRLKFFRLKWFSTKSIFDEKIRCQNHFAAARFLLNFDNRRIKDAKSGDAGGSSGCLRVILTNLHSFYSFWKYNLTCVSLNTCNCFEILTFHRCSSDQ